MRASRDPLLMEAMRLLSQRVAGLDPFYSETACLGEEERTMIGYCKAYKILYGEEDNLSLFMTAKLIPALKVIGIGKWNRGELTDLGFKISNRDSEQYDLEQFTDLPSMEEIDSELNRRKGEIKEET